MNDRLVSLLKWFELRVRTFQTGPLCRSETFDAADGLGYMHLLRGGRMRVEISGQVPAQPDEPSLVSYVSPTHITRCHRTTAPSGCASRSNSGPK